MCPGKEFVSVKIVGVKQHTQKSAIMLFKRTVHCILEKYTSTYWLFKILSIETKKVYKEIVEVIYILYMYVGSIKMLNT